MARGRKANPQAGLAEADDSTSMDVVNSDSNFDMQDIPAGGSQSASTNNSLRSSKLSTAMELVPLPLKPQNAFAAQASNRRVYVFGSGDCGQLGMGEDLDLQLTPLCHPKLANLGITKISAGGMHTLALSQSGHIYSWGCNDEKALGHAAEEYEVGCVDAKVQEHPLFVDIASGDSISAGISQEGTLFAWGTFRDSKGVLGYDGKTEIREIPSLVEPLSKFSFRKIFSGANHLLAITKDNVAYAWGCGEQGQLGRKVLERHKMLSLRPRIISPPTRRTTDGSPCYFVKFSCGSYHTLGLTNDGCLYAWGLNNHGQLGLGDNEDRALPELVSRECFNGMKILDLAAGEHHSIALAEDGSVYSFGRGDSYQLGTGTMDGVSKPVKIPSLHDIAAVASGSNHCFAINDTGAVFVWGFGEQGQLGTGKEEDEKVPVQLAGIKGRVLQASAGGQHSVLLVQE